MQEETLEEIKNRMEQLNEARKHGFGKLSIFGDYWDIVRQLPNLWNFEKDTIEFYRIQALISDAPRSRTIRKMILLNIQRGNRSETR